MMTSEGDKPGTCGRLCACLPFERYTSTLLTCLVLMTQVFSMFVSERRAGVELIHSSNVHLNNFKCHTSVRVACMAHCWRYTCCVFF